MRSTLDKGCLFAQGKAGNEKKNVFSCIIKTKWCSTSKILGGDEGGGQSGKGGGEMGGKDVTCKVTWSHAPSAFS